MRTNCKKCVYNNAEIKNTTTKSNKHTTITPLSIQINYGGAPIQLVHPNSTENKYRTSYTNPRMVMQKPKIAKQYTRNCTNYQGAKTVKKRK